MTYAQTSSYKNIPQIFTGIYINERKNFFNKKYSPYHATKNLLGIRRLALPHTSKSFEKERNTASFTFTYHTTFQPLLASVESVLLAGIQYTTEHG